MDKEQIQNLIKELIEKTTVSVQEINLVPDGAKSSWFSVKVSEPHFFLGRDGEALLALNHLARRMVEARLPIQEVPAKRGELDFLIDINDFQKKRVDNIRAIAHMMAERARYFKSSIEIDPMSAFERRIVHEFLSNATDLKTESSGTGLSRRVVIKYIGEI